MDKTALGLIALLGGVLLLLELPAGLSTREFAYVLSYATPLFSTAASFWIVRRYPSLVRKALVIAIVIWTTVGLIQTFIFPSFLTDLVTENVDLSENILASGRGVLGLAPEPTHNAIHSILLGGTLVLIRGPNWAVALSLMNALALALSSTALLLLSVGGLIWVLRRPKSRFWFLLPLMFLPALISLLGAFLGDGSRLGSLVNRMRELDLSLVLLDYSVNARIAGAIMPIRHAFENYLIPEGISHERWQFIREIILDNNQWVMELSHGGPASGYGLLLLQGGVFALPFVFYLGYRLIWQVGRHWLLGLASAVVFAVFTAQFYFTTPTFGLFLGILINHVNTISAAPSRRQRRRRIGYRRSAGSSSQALAPSELT